MTTATKTRNTNKAANRKAAAEALQANLVEQVDALSGTDEWMRFLTFAQAFHSYSINNVLLILSQCPDATQVAGFRKWQTIGRQVRKGERSLKIFGYSTKKITTTDEETGDEVEKRVRRHPILSVFDISQTDPIEGAEQQPEIAHPLQGTDDDGIGAAVAEWLTARGWSVEVEDIEGSAYGYTDGSNARVVIDANMAPAQQAKTFLHEAAHVLLHFDDDKNPVEDYHGHRGVYETEAESVAYVVAGLLGLDTASYTVGYVAGWSECDTDLIKATAANVLTAAHTLIEALDPTEDGEDQD